MSNTAPDLRGSGDGLRRHRKSLLAGIAGAAIIAVAAGNFVFIGIGQRPLAAPVPATSQDLHGLPSFADVVQQVTPAVVSIKVRSTAAPQDQDMAFRSNSAAQATNPLEQFFQQFRGWQQRGRTVQPSQVVHSEGSGFFVSDDGYIVTDGHVVENATQVDVVTSDGRMLPAKIIGTDPQTDIAVVKVDGTGFSYVRFADKAPRVGDWVVAVGNPFGLGETATAGIVSANGRDIGDGPYDEFMQIDAPVNRGNSGGPTFNAKGEVVGVNTAIYSPSGGSVGIGFAIPADTVKSIFPTLKDKGFVARGALGVQIQPVTQSIADALGLEDAHGALVDEAEPDSPAAKAGIAPGDVITAIDGKQVADSRDLARRVGATPPGTKVAVTIVHNRESKTVDATLSALPGAKTAAAEPDRRPENSGHGLDLTLAPSSEVPNAAARGVVVVDIGDSDLASEQGIKPGDVILDVNGKKVSTPTEVLDALRAAKSDHKAIALMRIQSGSEVRFVAIPVA